MSGVAWAVTYEKVIPVSTDEAMLNLLCSSGGPQEVCHLFFISCHMDPGYSSSCLFGLDRTNDGGSGTDTLTNYRLDPLQSPGASSRVASIVAFGGAHWTIPPTTVGELMDVIIPPSHSFSWWAEENREFIAHNTGVGDTQGMLWTAKKVGTGSPTAALTMHWRE